MINRKIDNLRTDLLHFFINFWEMHIDRFSFVCRDEEVLGQIILMNKCCMIWLGCGGTTPLLSDLSVSMLTPQGDHPISTSLIESSEGDVSAVGQSISRGLAKKYGVQSFISYNLPSKFDECLLEVMEPIFSAFEKAMASVVAGSTS